MTGLKSAMDVCDISGALVALLENGEYAQWMGHNGRVAVEMTFSWEKIAGRTVELYEKVLSA